jgi:DNA-binding CsgD family transcriptional regulator
MWAWGSTCSYPGRSGDMASVTMISHFCSDRQFHDSPRYLDYNRPLGVEHEIMLCLPAGGPGARCGCCSSADPGRTSPSAPGPCSRCCPHLHAAYLTTTRRHAGYVELTGRQREILRLVAAGRSYRQISRELGLSEATVRKHLDDIFARLGVTKRTAAAACAEGRAAYARRRTCTFCSSPTAIRLANIDDPP